MATGVKLVVQTGQGNSVTEVAVSPDGRWVASASSGAVKLWEAGTTREMRTILSDGLGTGAVAFSPDGKRLATGGTDRDVKLWDVLTGGLVRSLSGHTDTVTSVDISPNGRSLASASNDTQVKLCGIGVGS